MDALDLLEQQHLEVSALMERIAAEPSPGLRTSMVARLSRMIDAHVRIEETYLYPVCAERMAGDRKPLHDAYEKHGLARFAADNLLRTRATDVRFEARLRLLRDVFTHHADEEEGVLFPKAKRGLTDEQLDVIGCDLERAYEVLLRVGVPASSPLPRAQRGWPRRGAHACRVIRPTARRRTEALRVRGV
ncbi:hemerythrin domain-containing protein [Sorangium sp. So ce131]|uniref:hemerythrin domain-containing protein n=1 Tax=Sorangium sp. So ce131 TaxID=3133282 RepID=UPI003F639D4F